MHIEKNFFDNVFNIVMVVKGKTRDNENAGWMLLSCVFGVGETWSRCNYIMKS